MASRSSRATAFSSGGDSPAPRIACSRRRQMDSSIASCGAMTSVSPILTASSLAPPVRACCFRNSAGMVTCPVCPTLKTETADAFPIVRLPRYRLVSKPPVPRIRGRYMEFIGIGSMGRIHAGRTGGWTTIYDTAGLDGEVIVEAVAPWSCLQLRARGQERLAHEVRVHPARRLAPFPDRPHDQRLPPPRVPAGEHTRHRRLVVRPGLRVAALGECAAELRDHGVRLRAEEAEGQEHELARELELAAGPLLHHGAAVVRLP